MSALRDEIDRNGFAIQERLISHEDIRGLLDALAESESSEVIRRRGGDAFARRNLLSLPAIQALAACKSLRSVVEQALSAEARPVRGILFDKTAGANWVVPWHQDLSIAVKQRESIAGYGPWSVKSGVPHVQPPAEVLRQMITVRVHLDDCGPENGPLRVIPGTHQRRLDPGEIKELAARPEQATCTMGAGGVLVMRPMILHASSPATAPTHRRVIHLEYCNCDLPTPLTWYF